MSIDSFLPQAIDPIDPGEINRMRSVHVPDHAPSGQLVCCSPSHSFMYPRWPCTVAKLLSELDRRERVSEASKPGCWSGWADGYVD